MLLAVLLGATAAAQTEPREGGAPGAAASEVASAPASAASATAAPARRWIKVPRVRSRLDASRLGLVINTADPYSVQVGELYARARKLQPRQVLRLELPHKPVLTPEEFESLAQRIHEHFDAPDAGETPVEALALAWRQPYAVSCNSITGALALGYDPALCRRSCNAPGRASPYFNSASARPWTDHRLRPSMLLAAPDVASAQALIERGVAADGRLGRRGAPPVHAHFHVTSDTARSVRSHLFPPEGRFNPVGVEVHSRAREPLRSAERVLLYQTGAVRVPHLDTLDFVPGALGDHLTSYGGLLDHAPAQGQMTALAWLQAGATASYGTVSEPCNHLQKFPHPQVLLLHYLQGSTALEAYWKSVAWPQQGVFVGEPLAAPFARR
ncbi:TIGR03790 family protein [Aquabacterium sp. A7-Y]|uniref:TIGR03790 family protein n=1 Tax=Aquabacterium sp. A7-Y TaxID=1349605 RepID=UPI00223CD44F|nr:TIGR03790 family protein [Aquabacterium sp. A7-Y]MCW7541483.1 TIGR03790 family protein [Aquabacterium sp. A7-Y]